MTTNKKKGQISNYLNSTDIIEKAILLLNVSWLILNIISLYIFHNFYTSNKDKYGNIFNIRNALYIIKDPNYKNLLIFGFIVIGSCLAVVIFSAIFLANGKYRSRIITRNIVILSLIINFIIAAYSIGYFVIGVFLVGLCAAGATFASE